MGLSPWEDVSSTFLIRHWPLTSRSNLLGSSHGSQSFLSFDIDILCLARECIIMVRCVAYIFELIMTLTFELDIKIFSPWIWVWQEVFALWHFRHTKFWAYGCITMIQHVVYILDLSMTLTFDLYIGVSLVGFIHSLYIVKFCQCIFAISQLSPLGKERVP